MPSYLHGVGTKDFVMVELLFVAQMVRNPLQAMARRWYCPSLFRATRGKRRCAECTASGHPRDGIVIGPGPHDFSRRPAMCLPPEAPPRTAAPPPPQWPR